MFIKKCSVLLVRDVSGITPSSVGLMKGLFPKRLELTKLSTFYEHFSHLPYYCSFQHLARALDAFKSRISLYLPVALTEPDNGLTTNGGATTRTRPDSTSSRIASSTNFAWTRDDLLFLNTAGSGRLRKGSIYPLSITFKRNFEVSLRFQNSSFYERFTSTFTSGGWSVNTNSNKSFLQCICAIWESSSSNTSLFRTGLGLHSLAELIGAVRVAWGKAGSTVDVSGTRPSAYTVSCPVSEL